MDTTQTRVVAGTATKSPTVDVAGKPSAGRAWLVTFLLLTFMLINFADKAVLGLAAEPIMKDLGLSASQYGFLSSAFYLLFSVSAIAVGFLSNRVPTKPILLVLALVWAITMAPMVGAIGFGVLLTSRIVLGAAEGPANPMAMHAAHKWFPNEKRGLPSSLLNAGSGIGVAAAAPVLSWLIADHGWRSAFVALMVVGLVWSLAWLLVGKEGPVATTAGVHGPEAATPVEEPSVPYHRILLSGTWLGGFLSGFAAYWALAVLVAWVPHYLESVMGYDARTTGTLVVLPWAASTVFMLAQGALTDRLMRAGVSSRMARGVLGGVAVLVSGAAMVAFPHVAADGLRLALLTVAFGAGTVVFAIGITVNAEISPTRQRGAVLSISVGLVTLAGILSPYVTGRIIDAAASPESGYALAFGVAGVLLLIGGVLAVVFVRPDHTARCLGLRR